MERNVPQRNWKIYFSKVPYMNEYLFNFQANQQCAETFYVESANEGRTVTTTTHSSPTTHSILRTLCVCVCLCVSVVKCMTEKDTLRVLTIAADVIFVHIFILSSSVCVHSSRVHVYLLSEMVYNILHCL